MNFLFRNKHSGALVEFSFSAENASYMYAKNIQQNTFETVYSYDWDLIPPESKESEKTLKGSLRDILGQDIKTLEFK